MENKKEIIITIEKEEWTKAIDKAFEKANKNAKIAGFRPGKAPKEIFLKKYGIEFLLREAAEAEFHEAYHKMLDECKDLEIVARPVGDIKSVSEEKVEYVFTLTLRPEVKLGKYTKLGVKKEEVKVTKEEVAHELEHLLSRYSEIITKDGEIVNGDTAIIDFEGSKDGVPFNGGASKDYSLTIGSKTFIPGFEEELIGMKKGETKSFDIKFPEDYHSEDLKGTVVTFKVTVNEIKEKKQPELNKEFFEDYGVEGIDSKEKLEKQLEENIVARKEQQNEGEYINKLFEAAAKEMEVTIPEEMLEDEIDRILENYEQQLAMQGIKLNDYLTMTNSKIEDLRSMMKEEANNRIKYRLLLEEVSKVEKIEVTEEEVNELVNELSEKYHTEKEELINMYGGIESLYYEIKMRKAIDILKNN